MPRPDARKRIHPKKEPATKRSIDGKLWDLSGFGANKTDANNVAAQLRERGYKARVVKIAPFTLPAGRNKGKTAHYGVYAD